MAEEQIKNLDPWFDVTKMQSDKSKPMPWRFFNQWNVWVEHYSQCALTRPEDKLLGISGIADLVRETTHDVYLFGLWGSRFAESLMWRPEPKHRQLLSQPVSQRRKNRSSINAPSWSWASLNDAGALFTYFGKLSPIPLISLLPSQRASSDSLPSASQWVDQAIDGSLSVKVDGYVLSGSAGYDGHLFIEDPALHRIRCSWSIDRAPSARDIRELFPEEEKKHFAFLVCVEIIRNFFWHELGGLVLQPLKKRPETPERSDCFERVGWWRLLLSEKKRRIQRKDVAVYSSLGFEVVQDDHEEAGIRLVKAPEDKRRTIRLF